MTVYKKDCIRTCASLFHRDNKQLEGASGISDTARASFQTKENIECACFGRRREIEKRIRFTALNNVFLRLSPERISRSFDHAVFWKRKSL